MAKRYLAAAMAFLVGAASLSAQTRADSIATAVQRQMTEYPKSTLKDVYKNFFQDTFGPGHLIPEGEGAAQRMESAVREECGEAARDGSPCPDWELTGWHGRFVRVNLSVVSDGRVPFETFMRAFMESAEWFALPELEQWKAEWAEIEDAVRTEWPDLPGLEEDSEAIRWLLESGEYVSHHSEAYEKAYRPHYRLIERGVFEKEILPLLSND